MDGGKPEAEEGTGATVPLSLAGVKLVDAPVLFFVLSHKAFRKELVELHRIAVETAESGSHRRVVLDDLGRRFEFLKLVYKYHTAAEDELIFQALDTKVKNVVSTYSLENNCIDDDFNSVFHCLDLLRQESEDSPNLFQKLIFNIITMEAIICKHMLKEEEQVFPLLRQHFSCKEQAKLVWKYMCSVPIFLVKDFLPWMASSLCPDEQTDLLCSIKVVVPEEELLQEVVVSWLENNKQNSLGPCNMSGKGTPFCGGKTSFKDILETYGGTFQFGEEKQTKEAYSTHESRQNLIDGIHIWNAAIEKGFRKVLAELYQIRSSNNPSNLSSVVIQLQFFSDLLIFYSNVLDQIFCPMKNVVSENGVSQSCKLVDETQIARLENLLYGKVQYGVHLSNFLEGLCEEVELLLRGFCRILIFLETEAFPFISKNCNHEMQQLLLYMGLQTMPLGLLKCTVLWFSSTLSEDLFKSILDFLKVESPIVNKYFSSLLHEWVRMGYLGKTSFEKFTKDLEENFSIRSHFLCEQVRTNIEFSNVKLEMQAVNNFNMRELETNCPLSINNKMCYPSSSVPNITEKLEVSCSDKISVHTFFPRIWRTTFSVPKGQAMHGSGDSSFSLESRPMDQIFFFHKALRKDLENIVFLSAKLVKSVQFFPDLRRSLERFQFFYGSHTDMEDKIAFPFLESKGKHKNITHSYTIDHKLEAELFEKISAILNDISTVHGDPDTLIHRRISYDQLRLQLHKTCLSMQRIITEHINLEEIELRPLFTEYFSIEEQEKIVADMLGRTRAETLQEIIPWLMSSLTGDEKHSLMSLWRKVTKNTNFDEWLGEWWEGMKNNDIAKEKEGFSSASLVADPLELVSMYLRKDNANIEGNWQDKGINVAEKSVANYDLEKSRSLGLHETLDSKVGQNCHQHQGVAKLSKEPNETNCKEDGDCIDQASEAMLHVNFCQEDHPLILNQKELEIAIRRVSRDSTLETEKKSQVIQSLLMSRWILSQRSNMVSAVTNGKEEDMGQFPSYQDSLKLIFGCKHYRRRCKLLATCCNKLYTCIRCHDELSDHSVDRKAITKMMCMKCLIIQPVGPECSNVACNNFFMARYYCRICKLFDDERQIYHCPYCNLCRVGKGLGIDYFHCMNCNACMSRSLSVHICREKCFEDNCPICHEYIFTSNSPVKALPCGHLMHSACFQDYTCSNYTCPICSKSLGDMQVYFSMLDALLAEEKIPEEYSGQTQVVLCNDCESRGTVSFHWLYHKCPHCGSYNTRLL